MSTNSVVIEKGILRRACRATTCYQRILDTGRIIIKPEEVMLQLRDFWVVHSFVIIAQVSIQAFFVLSSRL